MAERGWLGRWFGWLRPAEKAPPPVDPAERSVRVFVSSTFRDMHGERDWLVRRVFPALRARLQPRDVALFEVDLRWGITEEQVERGDTLRILFSEVDRCRPFFIGLLGERYGYVPDALPAELREAFPAIARADGRSVTEMEMLHGVLADPGAIEAVFFLRDPSFGKGDPDFDEPNPESRAKLAALKARIRKSGARIVEYADPDAFGPLAEQVLTEILDRRYPPEQSPDPMSRAFRAHQRFARGRRGLHVGAESALAALDAWWASPAPQPMQIVGPTGAGKTALIANWVEANRAEMGVFEHYVGALPESADPRDLLRRLHDQLDQALRLADLVTAGAPPRDDAWPGDDLLSLADAVEQQLAQLGGPFLVALDGLDALESDRDLRWLPRRWPPNVKILLSGSARPDWPTIEVPALDAPARQTFADRTLAGWGRSLAPSHLAPILAHPLAERPLFLKTVLDELRYSATHDGLGDRVSYYLDASDAPDLFARMLARLEQDAEVGGALGAVWASRAGLEEPEILAVSGLSPLAWARARNGLGDGLRDQGGRITFGHDILRQAVEARYVPDPAVPHARLADRFAARPPDERQAEELPYQLRGAGRGDELLALLLDLDRFDLLRARGDAELLGWWLALGLDPAEGLCDAFLRAAPAEWTAEDLGRSVELTEFLVFAGGTSEALLALGERRLAASEALYGPDHEATLTSLNDLAAVQKARGDYASARANEERVLAARTRALGEDHPLTVRVLGNLATTLESAGALEEAQACNERAAAANARLHGSEHPDTLTTKSNLATTLHTRGDLAGARALNEEVLAARARVLGPDHRETFTSRNNLAAVLRDAGELQAAQDLLAQVAADSARVLGAEHPLTLTSRANLAGLLRDRGDLQGALAMDREVLEIRERLLGPEHPDTLTSLNGTAAALASVGSLPEARALFERAHAASLALLGADHPETLAILNNLALVRRHQGDLAGARATMEELLVAVRRVLGPQHPDTLTTAEGTAMLRHATGDGAGAAELVAEVLQGRTDTLGADHPATLIATSNLASILYGLGRWDEAATRWNVALAGMRTVFGERHPETLKQRNNLAALALARGDAEAARAALEEVVAGRTEVLGPEHHETLTAIGNLAQALAGLGRWAEARALHERVVEAETRTLGADHPSTLVTRTNLALACFELGELETAERIQQEVVAARRRVLGESHPSTLNAVVNLAVTLGKRGDMAGAERLHAQAAAELARTLGPDHPSTLSSEVSLATVRAQRGDPMAPRLLALLVERCTLAVGADHPLVATAKANLASLQGHA